ncbi:MAG: hypothetical protein ACI9MF_001949, partial [Gammaproteobacteria bacterium]
SIVPSLSAEVVMVCMASAGNFNSADAICMENKKNMKEISDATFLLYMSSSFVILRIMILICCSVAKIRENSVARLRLMVYIRCVNCKA